MQFFPPSHVPGEAACLRRVEVQKFQKPLTINDSTNDLMNLAVEARTDF